MSKLLLKNASIVTPERILRNDLLVEDKLIKKIAEKIEDTEARVIDCTGKLILPGMIDGHVHFREPGMTQKATIYSESRAAVLGGVTSYLDMPNNNPATASMELLNAKKEIAKKDSLANFGFYLGATFDNLEEIKNAPVKEIAGIKVFMGSSTGNLLVDKQDALEQIFENARTIIALHCEDSEIIYENEKKAKQRFGDDVPFSMHPMIRNRDCCINSTKKAIEIAKKTGARIHIMHISTKEELELLKPLMFGNVKTRQISAEACIPHLFFSDADYEKLQAKLKCNPAVKNEQDRLKITQAVEEGILTTIGTDHAPHEAQAKAGAYFKCASGLPSVQFALLALLDLWKRGELSLETIVKAYALNPATRFCIEKRGAIVEGNFADLVIVDPVKRTLVTKDSIASSCGWSSFEGYDFSCSIQGTIVNGVEVVKDGRIVDESPAMPLEFNR